MQSRTVWRVMLVAAMLMTVHARAGEQPAAMKVAKIWGEAPHSAFTDLIRWNERFYCVFREGSGHVPGAAGVNGTIRVIVSDDGEKWQSLCSLADKGIDLRDAKLSIMPDGRLMMVMGGSYYEGTKLLRRLSRVAFMKKRDAAFGATVPTEIDPTVRSDWDWLWRVTWYDGTGYGVVYQPVAGEWKLHLLKTIDGIKYDLVSTLDVKGHPNETTVRFAEDGGMRLIVRREAGDKMGYLGLAAAPYTQWTWRPMKWQLGGPNMIRLPDGAWLVGTREYSQQRPAGKSGTATVILRMNDEGECERLAEVPSGGDTSYPGMLIHDGRLWMSYYSAHEKQASIYLAKLPMDTLIAKAK